jgi:hypothetical protein
LQSIHDGRIIVLKYFQYLVFYSFIQFQSVSKDVQKGAGGGRWLNCPLRLPTLPLTCQVALAFAQKSEHLTTGSTDAPEARSLSFISG